MLDEVLFGEFYLFYIIRERYPPLVRMPGDRDGRRDIVGEVCGEPELSDGMRLCAKIQYPVLESKKLVRDSNRLPSVFRPVPWWSGDTLEERLVRPHEPGGAVTEDNGRYFVKPLGELRILEL